VRSSFFFVCRAAGTTERLDNPAGGWVLSDSMSPGNDLPKKKPKFQDSKSIQSKSVIRVPNTPFQLALRL